MRPYMEYRYHLDRKNKNQADVAKAINRGSDYVSKRFSGKRDFTISEGIKLLELVGLPHEVLHLIFSEEEKKGICNEEIHCKLALLRKH